MTATEILDHYIDIAHPVFDEAFRPDCCIVATKVTNEVLSRYFLTTKALSVKIIVANEAFKKKVKEVGRLPKGDEMEQWVKEVGAHSIGVGYSPHDAVPGRWIGHLVSVLDGKYMLDMTLGQATRPHKGIHLGPVYTEIPSGFLIGEQAMAAEMEGTHLEYMARPDDKTYRNTPDWRDHRSDEIVDHLLRLMKEKTPAEAKG